MNAEDNVRLARRWFEEVWNQRRSETVHELLLADSVGHLEHGDVVGPQAFLAVHAEFMKSFPDLQMTVEDVVAQGDNVVLRWSVSATHHGDGFNVPATGKPVRFRGITWMRFQSGKIAEGWDAWNAGGLMQNLGSGA
jgi:steroid delta-isomerase-like uncharacterized protein